MGTLYKRGDIWWIKFYQNGKPIRESSGSEKETEARRLLKKREGEVAAGKMPGTYFDRVRFDVLADEYLTDFRINGKDLRRAELSVKHLRKDFGGLRVTMITTPRIGKYVERRQSEGAANGTINRELTALKRMLNLGARQTPPKVDRVPHIPMLEEDNVRTGFFEHGEFLALREALPAHLRSPFTLGYEVGWRLEEILGLSWDRVDLELGVVRLNPGETKSGQGRLVYLDEELRVIFRAQWEARKGKGGKILPWVFLNRKDTDRIKRFDKAWKTACGKAKVGVKLFHDLRRTAVRNMVRAGVPERVAMMVSGHKTRSVFDRYNIVSEADLKLAARQQEEYLSRQPGTISGTVTQLEKAKCLQPL